MKVKLSTYFYRDLRIKNKEHSLVFYLFPNFAIHSEKQTNVYVFGFHINFLFWLFAFKIVFNYQKKEKV